MRRIGIATCYALVMVLTLLAPASAQVLDFTTIDVPGASAHLSTWYQPRGCHRWLLSCRGCLSWLPAPPGHRHSH